MNAFSLIVMVGINAVSFLLIRVMAPYQKNAKFKYIPLKSKFLAKHLIPEQTGYVKVNDRKKISLFSFIFYIMFAVQVIVLVALIFLPDIPCEPFTARFGKRGHIYWTVETLNEKLFYLLPIIFFLVELLTFFLKGLFIAIKSKKETKKALFGMFAADIILFVSLAFFVYMLF